MKINLLSATAAAATGYIFGAAAGHRRYRQITAAAKGFISNPRVQQLVFDLAGRARTNAAHLPGPAANLLNQAATRVQDALTRPEHNDTPAADNTHMTVAAPAEAEL